MGDQFFYQQIREIETALEQAGYDPHEQLFGYLKTGDVCYITRRDDARSKVLMLDQDMLRSYVEQKRHVDSK